MNPRDLDPLPEEETLVSIKHKIISGEVHKLKRSPSGSKKYRYLIESYWEVSSTPPTSPRSTSQPTRPPTYRCVSKPVRRNYFFRSISKRWMARNIDILDCDVKGKLIKIDIVRVTIDDKSGAETERRLFKRHVVDHTKNYSL